MKTALENYLRVNTNDMSLGKYVSILACFPVATLGVCHRFPIYFLSLFFPNFHLSSLLFLFSRIVVIFLPTAIFVSVFLRGSRVLVFPLRVEKKRPRCFCFSSGFFLPRYHATTIRVLIAMVISSYERNAI